MKIKKKSCSKVISTRIVLGLAKNATCNVSDIRAADENNNLLKN